MFEDKGFEFDTGLHYVGNIDRRKKYLDLAMASGLEWDQMGSKEDGYAYDEIVTGPTGQTTHVLFPAGREAFVASLEKSFPGQRENIENWINYMDKVNKTDKYIELKVVKYKFLARILVRLIAGSFFKYMATNTLEAIKKFVTDAKLISILLGQFGNYTCRPGASNLYTHSTVAMHYLGGGWYPRGGSIEIARKMIPTIERTGGRVLVRKGVDKILIENGKATGVVMETGDIIKAPIVISACGAYNTWQKLVPKEHVPASIPRKLKDVGQSASIMYLFVGLNKSSEELNLPSRNIWRWPTTGTGENDYDLDKMILDFQKDPLHAPVPMFCGFPSAKDSTFKDRYPGKSTAVLLTLGMYEWFAKWEHTEWGKRGKEYEEWKKTLESRILNEGLYTMWPQTKGHVEYSALGTSLTYNHFIGSVRGEAYGLDCHPERFKEDDWLRPQTDIPGLFMTGQDVALFGIAGALMSGVLSTMSVLGYGGVTDLMSGRNIVEDLWHLDAQENTEYSERSKMNYKKIYG